MRILDNPVYRERHYRSIPIARYIRTLAHSIVLRFVVVLIVLWYVCLPMLINDGIAVLAAIGLACITNAFFAPDA